MLDIARAYIPNADRTALEPSTDDEARRCDVFRIVYETKDGAHHEHISTLTARYIAHTVNGKAVIVVGVYETLDEKVKAFSQTYQDQLVKVTFQRFDFDEGKTLERKSYFCTLESTLLPYMCDIPDRPATYELLFQEI